MGVPTAQRPEYMAQDKPTDLAAGSHKSRLVWAKRAVLGTILAILIITILEFPPPIGFETRPQDNVSILWLAFFVVIVVTELAAIPLIYKHANLGAAFAVGAAVLNILQVIADQAHLMQPEVAPLGYSILEGLAVVASLLMAYFALRVRKLSQTNVA